MDEDFKPIPAKARNRAFQKSHILERAAAQANFPDIRQGSNPAAYQLDRLRKRFVKAP
jgi:uncharacterized protein (DUF2225 family)